MTNSCCARATFPSHRSFISLYWPRMTIGCRPTAIAAAIFFVSVAACLAADSLRWDLAHDRVDAVVETWTVPQLLGHVATVTGWEIYLDPAITNRIRTSFTGKETGDALRRLLGEFSY